MTATYCRGWTRPLYPNLVASWPSLDQHAAYPDIATVYPRLVIREDGVHRVPAVDGASS